MKMMGLQKLCVIRFLCSFMLASMYLFYSVFILVYIIDICISSIFMLNSINRIPFYLTERLEEQFCTLIYPCKGLLKTG